MTASAKRRTLPVGALITLGVVVVLVWASTILVIRIAGIDKASKIADAFGAVNALFSALAFLGVIVTVCLQSRELRLQRGELKLQRRELKHTRRELRRTADSQEKTEQALFATAYLNAAAAALNGYATELGDDRTNYLGTAESGHQLMLARINSVLRQLAGNVSGFKVASFVELGKEQLENLGAVLQRKVSRAIANQKREAIHSLLNALSVKLQIIDDSIPEDDDTGTLKNRIQYLRKNLEKQPRGPLDASGHPDTTDPAYCSAIDLFAQSIISNLERLAS